LDTPALILLGVLRAFMAPVMGLLCMVPDPFVHLFEFIGLLIVVGYLAAGSWSD
jgi:hypothetical protein